MDEEGMKDRTKQYALRIMRVVGELSGVRSVQSRVIADQLMRSGSSVAANYRAACRARSKADFVSKLGIVEEEADETCLWMELLTDSGMMDKERLDPLLREGNELVAILVASRKSAGIRTDRSKFKNQNSKIDSQRSKP